MNCHDCILGTKQTRLTSPMEYNDWDAQGFASLTSSCAATQYTLTTPTAYALGPWRQDAPQPTKTPNPIAMTLDAFTTTPFGPPVQIPFLAPVEPAQLPRALGTLGDCFAYQNHRDLARPSQHSPGSAQTNFVNSCGSLTIQWGTRLDDLIRWNPSLDKHDCYMRRGFSYCALQREDYVRIGTYVEEGVAISWTAEKRHAT
jgi:hypothetical protein